MNVKAQGGYKFNIPVGLSLHQLLVSSTTGLQFKKRGNLYLT